MDHFLTACGYIDGLAAASLDKLGRLVDLDSPSRDKDLVDRVGTEVATMLTDLGMSIEFDRQTEFGDNVIGRLGETDSEGVPRILMVGHMDTVFDAGTSSERPFRVEAERAYGPGVNDMKGGLIIGMAALEAARELAQDWRAQVTFIVNSDEEPGSPRSRQVLLREARGSDVALILEPGGPGPSLVLAQKGVGIFHLLIEGREAHAGVEPEKGVSSIVDAVGRVPDLLALEDRPSGTTMNVGVIRGGTEPYVVPGHCEMSIDVRVTNLGEQRRMEAGIQQLASRQYVAGAVARLTGGFHRPPMEPTGQTHGLASRFQEYAGRLGISLGIGQSGGASDGNLTAAEGIPTIAGLGTHGGGSHGPDEYIEIASLTWKAQILAGFLLDLNEKTTSQAESGVGRVML